MENQDEYLEHFTIISLAGQARSNVMEAIMESKEGNLEEAKKLMLEAHESLTEAHAMMFKMLQQEANGQPVKMNIVAVHAQDHISMATVMLDLGEEIINIYSKK